MSERADWLAARTQRSRDMADVSYEKTMVDDQGREWISADTVREYRRYLLLSYEANDASVGESAQGSYERGRRDGYASGLRQALACYDDTFADEPENLNKPRL